MMTDKQNATHRQASIITFSTSVPGTCSKSICWSYHTTLLAIQGTGIAVVGPTATAALQQQHTPYMLIQAGTVLLVASGAIVASFSTAAQQLACYC
jgi:hypothetical protein